MGVSVDRIEKPFKVKTQLVELLEVPMPGGTVSKGKRRYVLSQKSNAALIAVNELLGDGVDVYRKSNGDFFIENGDIDKLNDLSKAYNVSFIGTSKNLAEGATKLSTPKVGIYKSWRCLLYTSDAADE